MPIKPRETIDVLIETLNQCANDKTLMRRVENGRIHEDMVLVSLAHIAMQYDSSIRLVDLHVSNHPLEMRDSRDSLHPYPLGYSYEATFFLEADNRLVRLELDYRGAGKNEGLKVVNYSKEQAINVFEFDAPHYKISRVENYPEYKAGEDALLGVLGEEGLVAKMAEISACQLSKNTQTVEKLLKKPRL